LVVNATVVGAVFQGEPVVGTPNVDTPEPFQTEMAVLLVDVALVGTPALIPASAVASQNVLPASYFTK
jgi:hypothetical protein